jgi:hypothetical protein
VTAYAEIKRVPIFTCPKTDVCQGFEILQWPMPRHSHHKGTATLRKKLMLPL